MGLVALPILCPYIDMSTIIAYNAYNVISYVASFLVLAPQTVTHSDPVKLLVGFML